MQMSLIERMFLISLMNLKLRKKQMSQNGLKSQKNQ
jgi:hypothetical protein